MKTGSSVDLQLNKKESSAQDSVRGIKDKEKPNNLIPIPKKIIDCTNIFNYKICKIVVIDVSGSMNMKLEGKEYSRLKCIQNNKITELFQDEYSTGWYVYSFNDEQPFNTVFETEDKEPRHLWKARCQQAIESLEAKKSSNFNITLPKLNEKIIDLISSNKIQEKSIVIIYFYTDNDDEDYNDQEIHLQSQKRDDLIDQHNEIYRFFKVWEIYENHQKLRFSLGLGDEYDMIFDKIDEKHQDDQLVQDQLRFNAEIIGNRHIIQMRQNQIFFNEQKQLMLKEEEVIKLSMNEEKKKLSQDSEDMELLSRTGSGELSPDQAKDLVEKQLKNFRASCLKATGEMLQKNNQVYDNQLFLMKTSKNMLFHARENERQSEQITNGVYKKVKETFQKLKPQNKLIVEDIIKLSEEKMEILNEQNMEERSKSVVRDFFDIVKARVFTMKEFGTLCREIKSSFLKLQRKIKGRKGFEEESTLKEIENKINSIEQLYKETLTTSNQCLQYIFEQLTKIQQLCNYMPEGDRLKIKDKLTELKQIYEDLFAGESLSNTIERSIIDEIQRIIEIYFADLMKKSQKYTR